MLDDSVFVRYRDNAGNISPTYQADASAPRSSLRVTPAAAYRLHVPVSGRGGCLE
jgi:hypothetical protein